MAETRTPDTRPHAAKALRSRRNHARPCARGGRTGAPQSGSLVRNEQETSADILALDCEETCGCQWNPGPGRPDRACFTEPACSARSRSVSFKNLLLRLCAFLLGVVLKVLFAFHAGVLHLFVITCVAADQIECDFPGPREHFGVIESRFVGDRSGILHREALYDVQRLAVKVRSHIEPG